METFSLAVGGDHAKLAEDCLRAFLSATFSTEEQFRRRVAKLSDLERAASLDWSRHS